jgi:multidrug efflux pump subunit AcrA (membrane-fusion protein)
VQTEFRIRVEGRLQPEQTRDVFAPADALIKQSYIQSDSLVHTGDLLFTLERPQLQLELQRLQGEYETTLKRLVSVQTNRLAAEPLAADIDSRLRQLAAEEEELQQTLLHQRKRLELLHTELASLQIRSPIDGRVVTWDAQRILRDRPVQRGQVLVTVANTGGPWVVELRVPENRAGYVLAAQAHLEEELDVDFSLSTNPSSRFEGRLKNVALRTIVRPGSSIPELPVIVAYDNHQIADPRLGTMVWAGIHCGQRSLGYVLFHRLIDQVRAWW